MDEFNSSTPTLGLFQETLACSTPSTTFAFSLFESQDRTYTMFQALQSWIGPFANPPKTDPCLTTTGSDRSTATAGPDVGIERVCEGAVDPVEEPEQPDPRHAGHEVDPAQPHSMI